MTGGSITKERATDQQCPHCDRWWASRGFAEHKRNCDGESDNQSSDHDVFDPEPETPDSTMTDTDNEDDLECPECGESDDIVPTGKAMAMYSDAGQLTPPIREKLAEYTFYHNAADCRAVFDR